MGVMLYDFTNDTPIEFSDICYDADSARGTITRIVALNTSTQIGIHCGGEGKLTEIGASITAVKLTDTIKFVS